MMKTLLTGLGILLVLTMVTTDAIAQNGRGNDRGQGQRTSGTAIQSRVSNQGQASQALRGNRGRQTSRALLTDARSLNLYRLWEEEKLARDVYTILARSSTLSIFQNISRAESQHMQAVERLIRSSGAGAVVLNDTPGVFDSPDYQQLYVTLIASGKRSPLDALMVGARIEEMDIADLQRLLTQTTQSQVQQVLTHLMQGSQNHLRAFASQIARQGTSYNAEFLTQADFDQIANSSGQGHGQGGASQGARRRGGGSGQRRGR